MASSSDESFAWTTASNSSTCSSDNDPKVNHKMTENKISEDSDYGKNYKKKLHKKLLIKNETDHCEPESPNPKEKKAKRKKIDDDDDKDIVSPKMRKIKIEPESDVDTPKKIKKKKLKQQQPEESLENMSNVELQNYDDLNITVKEEQGLVSPLSKKQRKTTQSSVSKSSKHDMEYSMDNIKQEESYTELQETSCAVDNDETLSKKKKKKNKKRQHSLCEDDSVAPKNNCSDGTSYSQNNGTEATGKNEKPLIKKEKFNHKQEIKKECNSSNERLELSSDLDSDNKLHKQKNKIKSHENIICNASEIPENTNKRKSRISDGIKYDVADSTRNDTSTINQFDIKKSQKLKKFLKINENLKQISLREHNEWSLNSDDEVWAIRCPPNIDINSFLGTNIKLEKKCKVRIDDQTLVGRMNCESACLTVLSSEHNDYVIKKLPLNGTLHLHTKIPKVHVPDNIILNYETDVVPLPNTKKRHPFFGSNYKKAIKLPNAVTQKFNETFNDSISETITKKKKKKKHKNDSLMDIDNEQLGQTHESVPTDKNSFSSKKKNKKRKHEADNEHSGKKRVKHNADASAVWESEQAIEENLFNS